MIRTAFGNQKAVEKPRLQYEKLDKVERAGRQLRELGGR